MRGSKISLSLAVTMRSENIVHLVLAKVPGGPAGVKAFHYLQCPNTV